MRWALADIAAPQLAPSRRAADLPPPAPIDVDLAGAAAVRGILRHEPELRAEVRASSSASKALIALRRRVLSHYRTALRRRGGLS